MSLVYDPWSGSYIDVPDNEYAPPDPYGAVDHTPNVYVSPPGVQPPVNYEDTTNTYFLGGDPGPGQGHWIPPDASFGDNPSGVINNANPNADPTRPFVNEGDTGGYLHGVGVTAGAGQSDTVAQQQAAYAAALAAGVPEGWAQDWLARNPGDHTRLLEAYHSGNGGGGPGSGPGGGMGNQGAFAPPPNTTGWMPTLDLPTWGGYAPFDPGPAFTGIGKFEYPEYVKPADYVPGTFTKPTIEEARTEPGFQFALDEGRRQMEASAAAKGIGRTGGTVKRLIGYGQEMADTNYQNVFNRNKTVFDTNEDNRAGAYKTNAELGFQGWTGNRLNASDAFGKNYTTAKDIYDTGYTGRKDAWQSGFDTASFGHTAKTNELIGEFAPRQQEAVVNHQQAFAEWLAKMGIAQNIFNEGSD